MRKKASCLLIGRQVQPLQAFQAVGRDKAPVVSFVVLYSIANVATAGFAVYLFKFVLRLPDPATPSSASSPSSSAWLWPWPCYQPPRAHNYLYLSGMALMVIAVRNILFSTGLRLCFIALVLFYLPTLPASR